MNHREKYLKTIEDTFAEGLLTLKSKAADYSEDNDVFSNFRYAAQAAGVTIEQVLLVLLGIKMARLKNLLVNEKEPNNESVEDTLVDLPNYAAILRAYRTLKNSTDEDYAYAGLPEIVDEEEVDDTLAGVEVPVEAVNEELPPLVRLSGFFKNFRQDNNN